MKKRSAPQPGSRRKSKPAAPTVTRSGNKVAPLVRQLPQRTKVGKFGEVLSLIAAARQRTLQAVNTELVSL